VWDADAPAAVLYQQGYVGVTRCGVTGMKTYATAADRFYGVAQPNPSVTRPSLQASYNIDIYPRAVEMVTR